MRFSKTWSVAAGLMGTLTAGPAFAAINAGDFGLSQSGDNTDALQRAFDAARGSGQEVVIPPGNYAYSRQLTVDGVRVRGSSDTVLAPSDPYNQRITLTGNENSQKAEAITPVSERRAVG
jgi:hypothetical protein